MQSLGTWLKTNRRYLLITWATQSLQKGLNLGSKSWERTILALNLGKQHGRGAKIGKVTTSFKVMEKASSCPGRRMTLSQTSSSKIKSLEIKELQIMRPNFQSMNLQLTMIWWLLLGSTKINPSVRTIKRFQIKTWRNSYIWWAILRKWIRKNLMFRNQPVIPQSRMLRKIAKIQSLTLMNNF